MANEELKAKLEPEALETGQAAQLSAAISLKRIADVICAPPPPMVAHIKGDGVDIEALKSAINKSQAGVFVESRVGRKTTEITFETASVPDPSVTLEDAEPGLYLFNGELIVRTQYWTELGPSWSKPDCYIVASGEYFCGPQGTLARDIRKLKVTPVKVNLP